MYLQSIFSFLMILALSFTVMSTLEVINDMTTDDTEDFLVREELIPVDALAKESTKKNKRVLTSVSETPSPGKTSGLTHGDQPSKSTGAASTQSNAKSSVSIVNNETSRKPATASGSVPETRKPIVDDAAETAKGEDEIDLAGEGFLLVPEKVQSPSRKLSEFHDTATFEDSDSEDVSLVENMNAENVRDSDTVQESSDEEAATASEEAPRVEGPASEESLRSEDVEEPMMEDTEKVLDIACIDKSSWECLMFKEDYLAMKKDWNLSEKTLEKIRVKRQATENNAEPTSTQATSTQGQIVDGSGTGQLYPETVVTTAQMPITGTSTFKTSLTTVDDTQKNEIMLTLQQELEKIFKNVTGFMKVNVKYISYDNNGNITAEWDLIIDPTDKGFSSGNITKILDILNDYIKSVNGSYKAINIRDLILEGDLDIEGILKQVSTFLNDPCSSNPCTPGFSDCQRVDNSFEIVCTSNCKLFEEVSICQHSGVCELNETFGAYCSCTKNWEGERCETAKSTEQLDAGEITGVVLGAMAVTAGVVGCCFWVLACRKSNRDIAFSHYSDEDGSGNFSNPSSKLSAFVIDRPQISVNPIQVFRPTPTSTEESPPDSSFALRTPIESLGADPQLAPQDTYPYSQA